MPSTNYLILLVLLILISAPSSFSYPYSALNGTACLYNSSNEYLGYQISDLYYTDTTSLAVEALQWKGVGTTGTANVSQCLGIALLGGYNLLYPKGYYEKTYVGIPQHSIIYFRFLFYLIDNLQTPDTIISQFDGKNFSTTDMNILKGFATSSLCGSSAYDLGGVYMIGKAFHSASSLTLRIITNTTNSTAFAGVRRISLSFTNIASGDVESSCLITSTGLNISNYGCGCAVGKYVDPTNSSNCLSCSGKCNTCFGSGANQCFGCANYYYLANGTCAKCDSSCIECSGPNANQCTRCSTSLWYHWSGTCVPSCDSPSYAQKTIGSSIQMCLVPCNSTQYFLWNQSCSDTCQSPFIQRITEFGSYCDLPCSTGSYYNWNGTCSAVCSSPFIASNISGYATCNLPCASSQYYYYNNTCHTDCISPLIVINTTGLAMCNLPCAASQYLYYNGTCSLNCGSSLTASNSSGYLTCNPTCQAFEYFYYNGSCISACSPPLIPQNTSGIATCNLPCAASQYLYYNGTCSLNCGSSLTASNSSGYLTCNPTCQAFEYFYYNGSCLSACSPPLISQNTSGIATCNLPCPDSSYYYYPNKTCGISCGSSFVISNASGLALCSPPCNNSQYYWNNICTNDCDLPFVPHNISGFLTCDPFCADSEFYYSNSSCSPSCDHPFSSQNVSGVMTCNQPCSDPQYYYTWNGSCVPDCNSPYIALNISSFATCNKPCSDLQYLYWNNTCSELCNPPFLAQNSSDVAICSLPCAPSDYYYLLNGSCLSTCDYPFISQNATNLLTCAQPCSASLYYDWQGNCVSQCSSPLVTESIDGVAVCNAPCQSSDYYYWNQSCLSSCPTPYIVEKVDGVLMCNMSNQTVSTAKLISSTSSTSSYALSRFQNACSTIVTLGAVVASLFGFSNPAINTISGFMKMLPYMRYMTIKYSFKLQFLLDNLDTSALSLQLSFNMPSTLRSRFSESPIPENFAKYDLSSNFLVEYWQTLATLLMILIFLGVLSSIRYFTRAKKNLTILINRIILIFRWNFLLVVFANSFDELILSSSMQLRSYSHQTSFHDVFSLLFCVIINCIAIVLFCLTIYIIRSIRNVKRTIHSESKIQHKDKWKSCQILYQHLKTDTFFQHIFYFIFFMRLYLFYMVISYLYKHPLAQTILILLLNLAIISYLLIVKPFHSKVVFAQTCCNEVTMIVINSCLVGLALLNHQNSDAGRAQQILSSVIIYTNIWLDTSSSFFELYFTIVGLKYSYQETKRNRGRGIVLWLILFLSASGTGELEIEFDDELVEPHKENAEVKIVPTVYLNNHKAHISGFELESSQCKNINLQDSASSYGFNTPHGSVRLSVFAEHRLAVSSALDQDRISHSRMGSSNEHSPQVALNYNPSPSSLKVIRSNRYLLNRMSFKKMKMDTNSDCADSSKLN